MSLEELAEAYAQMVLKALGAEEGGEDGEA
jgi:hypothetical protein